MAFVNGKFKLKLLDKLLLSSLDSFFLEPAAIPVVDVLFVFIVFVATVSDVLFDDSLLFSLSFVAFVVVVTFILLILLLVLLLLLVISCYYYYDFHYYYY